MPKIMSGEFIVIYDKDFTANALLKKQSTKSFLIDVLIFKPFNRYFVTAHTKNTEITAKIGGR